MCRKCCWAEPFRSKIIPNSVVPLDSQTGVVGGFDDGKFRPNDAVTVEQVAVILHNFSGRPTSTVPPVKVGEYDDWAKEALGWALETDLLNGVPFTNVKENATRAQTVQMLMNYLQK